ncbi:hypothetical protein [Chishuiella sp.]|uniref:DUF6712 family protein n=1 Tax=Chishuiella sp. TaxID=1969467 RepID=UPI0028AB289E|nr:hypothetical protein [Chishuiella sp.]
MKLLINKQILSKYFQIGQGVSESDIEKYIQEAQELDLKPLLCEDFYYDLFSTNEKFKKVIEGGEFEYNGQVRFFGGIEKVIAYFAYARLILKSNIVNTTHGFVTKKTDFSSEADFAQRKNYYYSNRKDANTFLEDVKKYIELHIDQFHSWNCYSKCNKVKSYKSSVIK